MFVYPVLFRVVPLLTVVRCGGSNWQNLRSVAIIRQTARRHLSVAGRRTQDLPCLASSSFIIISTVPVWPRCSSTLGTRYCRLRMRRERSTLNDSESRTLKAVRTAGSVSFVRSPIAHKTLWLKHRPVAIETRTCTLLVGNAHVFRTVL